MDDVNVVFKASGRSKSGTVLNNDALGEIMKDRVFYNDNGEIELFYGLGEGETDPDKVTDERREAIARLLLTKSVRRFGTDERVWLMDPDLYASDLGLESLEDALESGGIDKHDLDYISVGTNFGDVDMEGNIDTVPGVGSKILDKIGYDRNIGGRIKSKDNINGCPSGVEATIDIYRFLKVGDGKLAAQISADTLSRVLDPYSINISLFGDAGGTNIWEAVTRNPGDPKEGIIGYNSETINRLEPTGANVRKISETAKYIHMRRSNNPDFRPDRKYMALLGPNVQQLALESLNMVLQPALDMAGITAEQVDIWNLHQAQQKMIYEMAYVGGVPIEELEMRVPIIFNKFANVSNVTNNLVMDHIHKRELVSVPKIQAIGPYTRGGLSIPNEKVDIRGDYRYELRPGQIMVIGSVGAGMDYNFIVYRVPRDYKPAK